MKNDKKEINAERRRLEQQRTGRENWRQWGPYLSERAWGTVREDYSPHGNAWEYFDHDQARSRAYRWSEDGLGGICDDKQRLCFALALWNGNDPILKERAFGLTGDQGVHGEDVKEYYFYLDATPSHSFLHYLYMYPQREYPYRWLVEEAARRTRGDPDVTLFQSGLFNESRYWEIEVLYAKAGADEIHVRIVASNRGPDEANLHLLPTRQANRLCAPWRKRTVPDGPCAPSIPCLGCIICMDGRRQICCSPKTKRIPNACGEFPAPRHTSRTRSTVA
jgi:hypothetical protein